VKNASVAVKEHGGGITFLRKLMPVPASKSYGIEVARLAGLPPEVLARARELLLNLEATEFDESGHPRLARRVQAATSAVAARVDDSQLGLFALPTAGEAPPQYGTEAQGVLEALEAFRVEASTPLDALNAVARWKSLLTAGKS
jgi:DNA mismatch repair protein MutS